MKGSFVSGSGKSGKCVEKLRWKRERKEEMNIGHGLG